MKYTKLVFTTALFLLAYLTPGNIFSDNIQKANKYYEQYDYKLALDIYEKIMKKKPSLEVAQKIANCYRFINDSEGAEAAYLRVLSFEGADPVNYKYYADALKQNGKFEQAKATYLLYGQKAAGKAEEAAKLANATDVARMWEENPDINVKIQNQEFLNSANSEFSPTPYLDGLVFTSDRWFMKSKEKGKKEVFGWTGNPYLKMYYVPNLESKRDIEILPRNLNSEFHNGPAVFTPGGDHIFFTRTESSKNRKNKQLPVISKKIYFAAKSGENWTTPRPINLNSVNYSIQHPALSPDGSILYFASDMAGGLGGMDIYASRKQSNGTWGTPKNCGPNINTSEDDVFPSVRKDGRFYFASKGHVGLGGLDIFTAEGSFDSFSIAENLKTPVNSPRDDFGIFFRDELNGYISSNRKGGMGLDDIYAFSIAPMPEPAKKDSISNVMILAIEGQAIDKQTKKPLPNTEIILLNKTTGEESKTTADNNGNFNFSLQPGMEYTLSGNREKFHSRQQGQITTFGLTQNTIFTVKFELERAEDAYIVKLNNIYYDFDKWNIRPDAAKQLNKVVSFLKTVSASNIQLRSHTDSRGKAAYNKWLSQKRAQSAVNYLVSRGVGSTRLSAVGLGETELLNRCRDGVKCSIAEHRINRRTEFKIIRATL